MKNPKISIMVITYNHRKYIAQALDSILMQETEYDYEIVVIEDCSTDGTQEVVLQYAKQYPDKVKPYLNQKNLGRQYTQHNFYQGYFRLTGEYMAILEGDDYWTSPHKIQKQVSFLEAHPEYVACAHNTIRVYEEGSREPHRFLYVKGTGPDHSIESLILMNSYFHTTTLLFRNVFRGAPPHHFRNRWSCEIFNTIAHAQFGKIRYFDDDMSVYRVHAGGQFSNMPMLQGWFFNIGGLRRYNEWLKYRYLHVFSLSIIHYCNNLLSDKGRLADLPTASQYLKYLGIRTLYQLVSVICYLVKGMHFFVSTLIRSFPESYQQSKIRFSAFYLRCLAMIFFAGWNVMKAITRMTYYLANSILPDFIRKVIRRLEDKWGLLRNIRVAISGTKLQ